MFNLNKFCKQTVILVMYGLLSITSVIGMDIYVYTELVKISHIDSSWLLLTLTMATFLYHIVLVRILYLLHLDIDKQQNVLTYELIKK